VQTIVFHSYKGGVGRSMALANLGIALSRQGQKVVMLDLDVEAPSLHFKLGFKEDQFREGYIDYLKQYYEGFTDRAKAQTIIQSPNRASIDEREASLRDVALKVDLTTFGGDSGGELRLIPAGNPLRELYWWNLGSDWLHILFTLTRGTANGNRRDIFENEKKIMTQAIEGGADFLLVDCKAASEYSSVALYNWADIIISMFPANLEGVRGAIQVHALAKQANKLTIPVVCRVPEGFTWEDGLQQIDWRKLDENHHPEILHEFRRLEYNEQLLFHKAVLDNVSLTSDYAKLFNRILEESHVKIPFTFDGPRLVEFLLELREEHGELRSLYKDKERNVALRTATLFGLVESLREDLEESLERQESGAENVRVSMNERFRKAGLRMGKSFGKELTSAGSIWNDVVRASEKFEDQLAGWCKFDSACGFGSLKPYYDPASLRGKIEWTNNFLEGGDERFQENIRELRTGYVQGILEHLLLYEVKVSARDDIFEFQRIEKQDP
jgi:MinD-like ATPase involved in chromosome partitioning or flagellar assembly